MRTWGGIWKEANYLRLPCSPPKLRGSTPQGGSVLEGAGECVKAGRKKQQEAMVRLKKC